MPESIVFVGEFEILKERRIQVKTRKHPGIVMVILFVCFGVVGNLSAQTGSEQRADCNKKPLLDPSHIDHVTTRDMGLINPAFTDGYTDNIINVHVDGKTLRTLTIQSVDNKVFKGAHRTGYSVWTRDLYWGFLGWAQAGNDSVLSLMKSSLQLLILAKDENQALGQSKMWPVDNRRFYIPQAYTTGFKVAMDFFPWCSESQADFLLLAYNYWKLSGDSKFIKSIWNDITYVTKTIELLDTNGDSLPDALEGSYDYQWVVGATDPLMCAKTSLAYSDVAKLARMLGKNAYARRLEELAVKVKRTMNKSVEDGGLWVNDSLGGHYVDMRKYSKHEAKIPAFVEKQLPSYVAAFYRKAGITSKFIPYENLVPMWCGMTNRKQDRAIFRHLDAGFKKYYELPYGPEYCAPAAHSKQSVADCSSVTWLGFMDVYLRGKEGHDKNRAKIFHLLMKNALDAGGIPFPEGMGIMGYLTGNAGRTWDNGNFFHMLICGVYGLEKSKDGIRIVAPDKIRGVPLTELDNFRWREAVYNFKWIGNGKYIEDVTVDGNKIKSKSGVYWLTNKRGSHEVEIKLYQ